MRPPQYEQLFGNARLEEDPSRSFEVKKSGTWLRSRQYLKKVAFRSLQFIQLDLKTKIYRPWQPNHLHVEKHNL